MTMHLQVGLSTLSTRKRKVKMTEGQLKLYKKDLAAHNKSLKQQGRHNECMTIEEYIDYRHGVKRVKKETTFSEYKPNDNYRRDTKEYKSLDTGASVAPKAETKTYTGTLVKGIATMHKSNAVPVLDAEYAKEISRMRRG